MRSLVARRPGMFVLGALAVPYSVTTVLASARRHLWNDELFTFYFARLPSLTAVWDQLRTGVEQTPPLFYVVTRACLWAFGNSSVAIRLPEIIGVFVACCAIYAIVARRTNTAGGAAAALIVLSTQALPYGYEARPYGLVLGFAALAMLGWQVRADSGSVAGAVLVALALGCAVSTHYYSVLLVVPIAAAELVRTATRRRMDGAVIAALVAGVLPLLAYAPLIQGADKYAGKFWTTFGWSSSWTFYAWLLRSPAVPPRIPTWALVVLVAAVVIAALLITSLDRRLLPETAAAVAFLLVPALAVASGKVKTGAYTERYALYAVLGLAVLVPLAIDRLATRWRYIPMIALVALAAFFLRACVYDIRNVDTDRAIQRETISFLDRSDPRLPIAAAHPHDYFELQRYADPALRSRLVYLVDGRLSRRYLGSTSTDDGLVVIARFADLDVRQYHPFLRAHREFLVFVNPGAGPLYWLPRALAADGHSLRLVASDEGRRLYLVR